MRASRLLSILILLQLNVRLTAQALAAEFEVSERTIYRDIDELSAAGVPVFAERGPGGGFQLLGGYRTDLTGLTMEEARSILMIGMPEAMHALGLGEHVSRGRSKLLAALPAGASSEAAALGALFHFDPIDWYHTAEPVPHLAPLARALLDRQWVTMDYESWRGSRAWRVAPAGLVMKAGAWYLVAQSGHDCAMRTFRVSNVQNLAVEPERFAREPDFDLAVYWAESTARFETELRSDTAEVRVSAVGLKRLAQLGAWAARAVRAAPAPAADGWTQLALPVEPGEQCVRDLLSIGAEIEVLTPALRARLREAAQRIADLNAGCAAKADHRG
ncbi:MAG: WYL domain-containing protein [Betaproteobacteria bacterium]|nr:WYL domain-containing protein [Betaproteobacteria bacterium]